MEVTSEDVAAYLPRIERLARSFNGVGGAEYDDLVQEGSLKVFLLLRNSQPVSTTAIKNAMRDWVRYCRRKGQSVAMDDETLDYYDSAAPGRKKASIHSGEDYEQRRNEWSHWADLG